MTYQRAVFEQRSAALSGEFGKKMLGVWFGQATADLLMTLLPRYARGPRKGEVKGYLHWTKVVKGGWLREGPGEGNGRVLYPGTQGVTLRTGRDPASVYIMARGARSENQTDEAWAQMVTGAVMEAFAQEKASGSSYFSRRC